MSKCPKCGTELKDGMNVCTNCGTKVIERKKGTEGSGASGDSAAVGLAAGVLAAVGIILLFAVSAIIGGIVYLLGFGMAMIELRKDDEFAPGNYVQYAKSCFSKENIIRRGIPMIVVVLIPFVVIVGTYRWIIVDTIREVEFFYGSF